MYGSKWVIQMSWELPHSSKKMLSLDSFAGFFDHEFRILYSKSKNVHVDLLLYLVKIEVLLLAESFVRVWVIDDGEVLVQQLYGEYISMLRLLCVNEFYCIFLKCLSTAP